MGAGVGVGTGVGIGVRQPDISGLKQTAAVFAGFANVDRSWHALLAAAHPGLDLSRAEHRALLLRWLNSWGCRIRYPREGEPAPFDDGLARWWKRWGPVLPEVALAELPDEGADALGRAYAELAAIEVSAGRTRRTLGPTAAAKALYALRPDTVMPWDAAIAEHLHGVRDGAAFSAHQRLGRQWARAVAEEAGVPAGDVPGLVGARTVSLAKLLDEHLYVTVTMAAHKSA
jgi:hypothetical protein